MRALNNSEAFCNVQTDFLIEGPIFPLKYTVATRYFNGKIASKHDSLLFKARMLFIYKTPLRYTIFQRENRSVELVLPIESTNSTDRFFRSNIVHFNEKIGHGSTREFEPRGARFDPSEDCSSRGSIRAPRGSKSEVDPY